MRLGFNATFQQLYQRDGLIALDAAFIAELAAGNPSLHNRLVTARANPDALAEKEHSQLIIDLAPSFEDFLAELFNIRAEVTALKEQHFALSPLYSCKRLFVQRKAAKSIKPEEASGFDITALEKTLRTALGMGMPDKALPLEGGGEFELAFARHVMHWLDAPELHADALTTATRYAGWAVHTKEGQEKHAHGILFKAPRKLDPSRLVPVETEVKDGVTILKIPHHHRRIREGFGLTDNGGPLEKALDEANYCIWCHNQGKDSCSKGMKEKDGSYKRNALGITLAGCPLEEKISEMNFLKSEGIPLGALATIVIDNPMCAGTGHRICNDCMKSCIYQKQEPVNIPQAETRSLRDILALPYGFEIYSLLTRWNPLNIRRPLPKPDSGRKVLVAGLGPAGYTLSHHLMNDGHTVVGVDGLKIEPLPEKISGVNAKGARVPFEPIRDISTLFEKLDERSLAGFGGVAEYGITVRWDKNFLKVIRLLLERREQFALIGGVRFGSTITIEGAWELGFDHIALCMGAGKPTVIEMPGGLSRGVRAASDFLMALQLTGAGKKDSIANLQLRLPVVVIGGGLTAIDTSTESLAYYPVQVEKFLSRYEALARVKGEDAVRLGWSEEDREIAEEFLTHARAIREERKKPLPDIGALLDGWGGVKMVYRKRLIDAPSYRLNNEEVEKALEEGIGIAESLEPVRVEVDKWGHAKAVVFKLSAVSSQLSEGESGQLKAESLILPARSVLVAAGTAPNTVLAREIPESVTLHGRYFQALDEDGNPVSPEKVTKPKTPQVLMSLEKDGRAVSFFGDLHPSFAGNVVGAMGSAKQGYPVVSRILAKRKALSSTLPLQEEGQGGGLKGGVTRHASGHIIENAKSLRQNLTEAEKALWYHLRAKRFEDYKFRRQQPIGEYVVDFVCLQSKLIIELDGGQHATQVDYDERRTTFLKEQGFTVLRFWNNEVTENLESVLARIIDTLSPALSLKGEGDYQDTGGNSGDAFLPFINAQLRPTVHNVIRLTPNIVEVIIKAPQAARQFEPGQFYRLQNYEANALKVASDNWQAASTSIHAACRLPLATTLAMEGLALTGAWVDKEKGLLSTIVLEMGGSSDLCAYLKKGEPVVLMGPTGTATHIPENKTMLLVGGGLGNAVLFSIGREARAKGNKVLYFAGYKKESDRYKMEEIEAAADVVVWCCDENANFAPSRPQDKAFHGNIVLAMLAYAEGRLGPVAIPLGEAEHLIAIGSDRMMAAVEAARRLVLKSHLKPGHVGIGSINSPMQCMMKEICAQCLQQHIDPATGVVSYVYSCNNQDQPLDTVSFEFLSERLRQNALQEKLTGQWIDMCLKERGLRRLAA